MAINAISSQVVATMFEQVRPKLQSLLAKEQSAFSKLFQNRMEKHRVSAWTVGSGAALAWRIPVELARGGDYQAISLDGGDLGTGSMMNTAYMTIGYYATDIAYQVPFLATYATTTTQQAIVNVLKKSIGDAISESSYYNEIGLFQDGTGILATATAVTGAGTANTTVTYTLETAAFTYIRIRGKGQLVDVVNGSNAILAVGLRVLSINFATNQVSLTVGATGYTPTATDSIVFPGMGPVTTTISSGSFRYGIYTYNTTNTTGSLLGLAYSNAYELACPVVNGASGFFTPAILFSGKSQLIQRRDDKAYMGTVGVCHMAQRTAWYEIGITIANQFLRPGEAVKNVDLAGQAGGYGDTFEAGEVTHYVSRFANKSRVDWFNPTMFGKVQLDDMQFVQSPEGQRTFIGHSTTTGNPTAGWQFYMSQTDNVYSADPGCSVVFYSLSIPAGQ